MEVEGAELGGMIEPRGGSRDVSGNTFSPQNQVLFYLYELGTHEHPGWLAVPRWNGNWRGAAVISV